MLYNLDCSGGHVSLYNLSKLMQLEMEAVYCVSIKPE